MSYSQLTQEQRYLINHLLKMGVTQTEIAKRARVHKSTISRELARNTGKKGYRYKQAQRMANQRRRRGQKRLIEKDWEIVEDYLQKDFSPEQVSGWALKEHGLQISHEWIYQHIWEDKKNGGDLYEHLRRKKKYLKRGDQKDSRGRIPNQKSIDDRPEAANERERVGDWEGDTIIGKGKQGAIVTMVDRKSRYLLMRLVDHRTKEAVGQAIIDMMRGFPVRSITLDNGKEFADHELISQALGTDVYFAHPYSSWERGTNENTNGLIRQYIPKSMKFSLLSKDDIISVENRLNSRPRKCLDFEQPMTFLKYHCCT